MKTYAIDKAIAKRVREARVNAGLSQEEVAGKLGLTDGGYGHYERGRQSFTLEMIFKLTEILCQSVEYFLGLDTGLTADEDRILALYREARATCRSCGGRWLRWSRGSSTLRRAGW